MRATGTALQSSNSKLALGGSVTLSATVTDSVTATVTGQNPAGTVAFLAGTTVLGTAPVGSGGIASFTTTRLPAGAIDLTATYGGDGQHDPSTSPPVPLEVVKPWLPAQGFGSSSNLAPLAALTGDGPIQEWGTTSNPAISANGSSVDGPSGSGYGQVFSTRNPFAALKPDDSISAWGLAAQALLASTPGSGYTPLFCTDGGGTPSAGAGPGAPASASPATHQSSLAPGPNPGLPFDLVILSPELAGSVPQEELAGARVVILDANRDAISQVGAALQANSGASVVRLISHGQAGRLSLAGQEITTASLQSHAEAIAGWRQFLAPGADLLLYGCSLAATSEAGAW
jgi:hypothetical protein